MLYEHYQSKLSINWSNVLETLIGEILHHKKLQLTEIAQYNNKYVEQKGVTLISGCCLN